MSDINVANRGEKTKILCVVVQNITFIVHYECQRLILHKMERSQSILNRVTLGLTPWYFESPMINFSQIYV